MVGNVPQITSSSSEGSNKDDLELGRGVPAATESNGSHCNAHDCCVRRGQVFWLLTVSGFGLSVTAFVMQSPWLLASSLLLLGLSAFSSITLGGDLFQTTALREAVTVFHQENKVLQRQNGELEAKASELREIAKSLERVEHDLGQDVQAVHALVRELETFTSVQLASAMLNMFFAADLSGAGHITGTGVDLLFQGLTCMWQLVPDLGPSKPGHRRLLRAAKLKGMHFGAYALLVQATVDGDAVSLRRKLEALSRTTPRDDESEIQDLEMVSSSSSSETSTEEDEALAPCFRLGPLRIWSKSHASFLFASMLASGFLLQSLMPFGVIRFLCAAADLGLAGSLTAYGKLVVVKKALREELKKFRTENERLSNMNKDLGQRIADLAKMQRGLEALQIQFHGCATRARSTIQRSNASVKISAITALNRLFAKADANADGKLTDSELEEFITGFELIFRNTDKADIRRRLLQNGLQIGQVKELVELVLADSEGAHDATGSV